jgi:Variant SH3 domain
MEAGKTQELTKKQKTQLDNQGFYRYCIISSCFPIIGIFFSLTCEPKLSRVGAQIGTGISFIFYGVYMVAISMVFTADSDRLALENYTGDPALAVDYASAQVGMEYYLLYGLCGWVSVVLGAWVMHSVIGTHYRDNGKRIVTLVELDKEPLKRCSIPVIGVLISFFFYKDSRTKFLTGAIGSSFSSIVVAALMFVIGVWSPKSLSACVPLFITLAFFGGVGLVIFWWRLRILLLSFQISRELQSTSVGDGVGSQFYQNSQVYSQASPVAAFVIEDDISKLIDNVQEPSAGDAYIPAADIDLYAPPAPTSHVAIENYKACEEDEMNFQNGDLIGIEKDFGDGWALGQNISKNRKRGVFPLNLVTAIVTGPTQNVSRKKTSFLPRTISMKTRLPVPSSPLLKNILK